MAEKAERLLRNLARSLEREAPGVAAAILEGLDEILTVIRLGLPRELRRSLACTNIIENMLGSVRRVCRNVKRWRDASIALRWTAAAMLEAAKGFRPEWQDLLRDLDRLQQGEIEQDGKTWRLRTEVGAVASAAMLACGIAIPPRLQGIPPPDTPAPAAPSPSHASRRRGRPRRGATPA